MALLFAILFPHFRPVLGIGQLLTGFGQNDLRLVGAAVQLRLLDLQNHGGKGAVGFSVPAAGAAVGSGLLRRAVEQHGNVDAPEEIAVAMGPFDDQHRDLGKINFFVPESFRRAPHTLEPDVRIAAFEAGNDIIVFRFNKDEEQRVLNNIVQLVESGKIKENRIDRSVNRIIEIKEKYDISDKQNFEGVNVDKINEKIIDIRKKCNIENT